VSYLARPTAYGSARLLVVHATGSGKTATMIRIADNFFKVRVEVRTRVRVGCGRGCGCG